MKPMLTMTVLASACALSTGALAQHDMAQGATTAAPQTSQQARTSQPGSQAWLDGGATLDDVRQDGMGGMDRRAMTAMDQDGDGMVSKAEYLAYHEAAFDRMVNGAARSPHHPR